MRERYTCCNEGISVWRSRCGRFLVARRTGRDETWMLRKRMRRTALEIGESGILDLELRWRTRHELMEALSEVCRLADVPEPGRLERDWGSGSLGWSTVDGTVRLTHVPANPPGER